MKFEYDPVLYRKIASFHINEIFQVSNRKGRRSTIHVTNITKLSWHELQLLVHEGPDRFSKMVLLYKKYTDEATLDDKAVNGSSLSTQEASEIDEYIRIFRENGFSRHTEVNNLITENELWDNFQNIRSLNDHGKYKRIEGIQPKYFEIICQILKISHEGGLPLDSYTKY